MVHTDSIFFLPRLEVPTWRKDAASSYAAWNWREQEICRYNVCRTCTSLVILLFWIIKNRNKRWKNNSFTIKLRKISYFPLRKTPGIPRGEMGEITREKEWLFSHATSQWERAISPAKFKLFSLYWIFQEVDIWLAKSVFWNRHQITSTNDITDILYIFRTGTGHLISEAHSARYHINGSIAEWFIFLDLWYFQKLLIGRN